MREMALAGEPSLALDHAQLFGLDPGMLEVDPAEVARQVRLRQDSYLQFPLPAAALHFVDSEAGLAAAAPLLEASVAGVLGLDAEWGQSPAGGGKAPVSLLQASLCCFSSPIYVESALHTCLGLVMGCCSVPVAFPCAGVEAMLHVDCALYLACAQVASRRQVLLLDLLALGSSAALDAFLAPLLRSPAIIKAGCGIRQDLAALARSYPALRGFSAAAGVLDLRTVFAQHVAATGLPVSFLQLSPSSKSCSACIRPCMHACMH